MKKLLLSALIIFGMPATVYSQVCGGTFTDPAGAAANYIANSDYTVTIAPTNPGDVVTVTFTAFNTEATFDALYVFNGSSIASPQIASTNAAENTPGGLAGGYWGSTIPGPFTSTDPSGSLTFRFRSDASVQNPGWQANVTCAPPPTCLKPTILTTSSITSNSALLGWTNTSAATSWEVIAVPCGSPAPTISSVGQVATTNSYLMTGLAQLTCYDFYVRAICSPTDSSLWAGPKTFTTQYGAPHCGEQFTDIGGISGNYPANSDSTIIICPDTPGSTVSVTFTSFTTEANWDALYVFDGNSIAAPQIASTNGAENVPGGLAGGYWGITNPGIFTSSDASGCLTFRFRSDGSGNSAGWAADVSCFQQTSCLRPTVLVASVTLNTATVSWTENNSATSWEVLCLPCGSTVPTASDIGAVFSTTTANFTGLTPGTCYNVYVRSICSSGIKSIWSVIGITTSPVNDDCVNAIAVPLNTSSCSQATPGTLTSATPSSMPTTTCLGTPDDDVWYKFVATNPDVVVSFPNITGTTTNFNIAFYSGSCGSLTQLSCTYSASNLVEGQTYYIRVYSNSNIPQTVNFTICVATYSGCPVSQSVCGINNYANSTGVTSLGTIGCLNTSPNPTYFNLKIAESGPVNLLLTQAEVGGTPRDVDYAAWGPFVSKDAACAAIRGGQAPGIGVPLTQTTGCSYSSAATEYLNIANAVAGEFYIILITNFSNVPGYISLIQTNTNNASAGSIDCSGIGLNAFIDTNSNGTQDSGEINFPLGQFQYTIDASAAVHHITTPSGVHTIYDDFSSNAYNLSYVINPELSSMYSTSATYSNVIVASGGMNIYNFPITSLQNYNDIGVTLVPLSSPRAGATYQNKIIYTNNGNQAIAAGSLTFNKNIPSTITNISQTGTTPTATGFTYNFTNLLPFESRTIVVTMSVPAIPTVSIGQLLANTAAVTPVGGDFISNNNTSTQTQAVTGSYDPNDKSENHGGKILFSSFGANDYLYYTIRFENTGTSGALNIRVSDLLDNKLDENSLMMLNASHPYSLDRVGQLLDWKFNNIQLPVSVPNTDIGKGYINFKIKPKAGYAVGDIIPNTASIYFDSNPAIVTNTFTTEFVQVLGNQYYDFSNLFVLSPVPVKDVLHIAIKQAVTMNLVSIYNTLGQLVQAIPNPDETIDVSGLQTGTYFIRIISDKGTAGSKFIKQ
jgi:uncharacterized repeat protein (TIGR01451 family)